MAYFYATLLNTRSIRLLHILPSACNDAPLKAHLVSYQLDNACSYEALSYVWGEPDVYQTLTIGDQQISVSQNLYSIIVQLRRQDRIRTLWIDAICINQQDSVEKSLQVAIMSQIFQQADKVLCWLGNISDESFCAVRYLQQLADKHCNYIQKDVVEDVWSIVGDTLVPDVDVKSVAKSAQEAHINSIYNSEWFTRLWTVQEAIVAKDPFVLCGQHQIAWKAFELATRVLSRCTKELDMMNNAYAIVRARAQHALNVRPIMKKPLILQLDQAWSLGSVAWRMRHRNCRDDRDRVYALLSLTAEGNSLKLYKPAPINADYTRSVEWAYAEFWGRYGGYTSLFYAGLSRRGINFAKEMQQDSDGIGFYLNDNRLPSWCPELRPQGRRWAPCFSPDYAASMPMHHMACNIHGRNNSCFLFIRGHRFDAVEQSFYIRDLGLRPGGLSQAMMIRFLVSKEPETKNYPSGQTWTEALGFALLNGIPSGPNEADHPFRIYLDQRNSPSIDCSNAELLRIWKIYLDGLIIKNSVMWSKLWSIIVSSAKSQEPREAKSEQDIDANVAMGLSDDEQIILLLHDYLGEVLLMHRFIITERGYMGLAPPDTGIGDVIAVIGGPGTPFIIRDTPHATLGELAAGKYSASLDPIDGRHSGFVANNVTTNISHLMGPCYIQGIMDGEIYKGERFKGELEWETDQLGTIPKPTICLV